MNFNARAAAAVAGPGTVQQRQQLQAAAAADNELSGLIGVLRVIPRGDHAARVAAARVARAAGRANPLQQQLQEPEDPLTNPFIINRAQNPMPANGGQKKKQTRKNSKKYKNKKYKNKNRKDRQTRKTKKGKM